MFLLDGQLLDTASFLENLLYHGKQRSRALYQSLPLKLNIEHLCLHVVKFNGSNICLKTWISTNKTTSIYYDSQSERPIAHNNSFHERTKRLDIDCHVVREKLQQDLFHLLPISTEKQPTDLLITKPLHSEIFHRILSKLDVQNIHPPALGGVLSFWTLFCFVWAKPNFIPNTS